MALALCRACRSRRFIQCGQELWVILIALVSDATFLLHIRSPRTQRNPAKFLERQVVQFRFDLGQTHNVKTLHESSDSGICYFSSAAFPQITSANVRSVLRKYQMPVPQRTEVRATEVSKDEAGSGTSPRSSDQRKPSITPTIGLKE